ncbi:UpxY family transcription antiterminator [Olivibacter sp. SDN3]|uniref:UpxY family transcription antiterminator n=1 Tax=Olivibacter sp. SDN3 TaxID=2764720 RepID=UPI00165195BE|nr:UpxY family transcription antiterminator [Olivibacter sp. SDN3]QNL51709.1 UpxY family transcription antiterminator [Olivibacter sp. SDN3]
MYQTIITPQKKRNWMVVYTRSNYEKKVSHLLSKQHIHFFCPLIKIKKQWTDRKVTIEQPLFQSYVFVHVDAHEQLQVLQTTGVVNFVNYNNSPAIMAEQEITQIKSALAKHHALQTVNLRTLHIGDHVKLVSDVFGNSKGEVLEIQEKNIVVIIKQLDCALVARIKVPHDQITTYLNE